MSEPFWSALGARAGAGGVDYEGAWSAITAYLAGDVVAYNGINYLAVNPSTGITPAGGIASDIGLAFPASPFDGQEFTLVDSLTAPTYSWKFRYMAAKASNKWLFIGGTPIYSEVATEETSSTTPGSYVPLATAGPSIVVPVAGDYSVILGAGLKTTGTGGTSMFMSYDIGGTAAVDADALMATQPSGTTPEIDGSRTRRKSLAAVTLTAKYKCSVTNITARNRTMQLLPIAVGG